MEFFQHFVQAEPFAFVHGLIESFPVKDPHRKDRFRSESALCGSPQRAVEELDLIARRPFFLWHDPLGDPPQVFEAPQTARTTWNEQLVSVRLPPTEVQGKPDPDPCAIHNQMFRPDLIADPSLLNQISEFFHELLGAFHRFQHSPPRIIAPFTQVRRQMEIYAGPLFGVGCSHYSTLRARRHRYASSLGGRSCYSTHFWLK
jgi:hypothetical protein